jgi:hypothetical protein
MTDEDKKWIAEKLSYIKEQCCGRPGGGGFCESFGCDTVSRLIRIVDSLSRKDIHLCDHIRISASLGATISVSSFICPVCDDETP